MKIVLIEPDKVLADTYREALTYAGHTVVVSPGAQEAIFTADELQPDVVVMELQLTAHSGIEFLYEFRSYDDWVNVPVILLTNVPAGEFAGSWDILREQLGIKAYHYKPLTTLQTLLRSVDSLAPVRS
jgi:DNA-binding response OmpR family regulator